jgi:hypothetical protein
MLKGYGPVGLGSVGKGKALSNIDLENKLKGKKGFAGVFSVDTLPPLPKTGMSLIVNLEPSTMEGSHWVAVYITEKHVVFFDPFGLSGPHLLNVWMRKMKKPIIYNNSQLQDINSQRCGEYCFYFVNEMIRGTPLMDVLNALSQKPSISNEKKIEKYYRSH